MANHVLGKNVLVKAKKSGAFQPFLCVEEVSVSQTAPLLETVSTATGGWAEWAPEKKRSWEMNLRGVTVLTDASAWTLSAIWALIDSFASVDVQLIFTDTGGATLTKSGKVFLTELTHSGSVSNGGEPATWDAKFTGTGALT